MPYSDSDQHRAYQREYQRAWVARRRAVWFTEHGPCVDCSSADNLQLDHVDPKKKVSHCVWSWSEERRKVELEKCVVRCYPCHVVKTNDDRSKDDSPVLRRLTATQVIEISERYVAGERQIDLAREFGISKQYVGKIVHGITRRYEVVKVS